jgi:hypothetical protein
MQTMNNEVGSSWLLIAQGQLGDQVFWEPGFEVFERAQELLCLLEEVAENVVDLEALLDGLNLAEIETMDFPPLYNIDAFEEIDGFLAVVDDSYEGGPGQSFNNIDLYVDQECLSKLKQRFKKLAERLEAHPALTTYV